MLVTDADWAGDVNEVCGTAVSWKSQKQSYTALCTAEAEYLALSQATQEAICGIAGENRPTGTKFPMEIIDL